MSSVDPRRALLNAAAAASLLLAAACGGSGEAAPPAGQGADPSSTAPVAPAAAPLPADAPVAVVYKDRNCGCCNSWVAHMRQNGFRVEAHDTAAMDAIKNQNHVPVPGRSCHTALVGKYVIEGHVPADLVKKLLAEHPADIAGLAVPGMVTGSPGMEGPNPQHYDVIAFTRDGQTRVYASR